MNHQTCLNPGTLNLMKQDPEATYIGYGGPIEHEIHGAVWNWAMKALTDVSPQTKVFTFVTTEHNPSSDYFNKLWTLETNRSLKQTKTILSNGFYSVITALNLCESVTIFGLDGNSSCNDGKQNVKVS